MKLKIIYYINILLGGCIVILLLLFLVEALKQKQFEKRSWASKIEISPNISTDYMVKVINAKLFNTHNKTTEYLQSDQSEFITNTPYSKNEFYPSDALLPDSISFTYYAISEDIFYKLNQKLPYEEFKNQIGNNGELTIKIKENGNVDITSNERIISKLKAQKYEGEIKDLTYSGYQDSYYNNYPGINKSEDFSKLLIKKYPWKYEFKFRDQSQVSNVFITSFFSSGDVSGIENDNSKLNRIPKYITVDFKRNNKNYRMSYDFIAGQIFSVFEELNQASSQEPIKLLFEISENNVKCTASRGGKTYHLKSLYPNEPSIITLME